MTAGVYPKEDKFFARTRTKIVDTLFEYGSTVELEAAKAKLVSVNHGPGRARGPRAYHKNHFMG